jgi:hypothetical protein
VIHAGETAASKIVKSTRAYLSSSGPVRKKPKKQKGENQMVKTLPEKHPNLILLREAEQKLNRLRKQKREKENSLEEIREQYSQFAALPKQERLETQAAALLADAPMKNITRDDIERASRELEVLLTAITTQERIVAKAAGTVSRQLHEVNRDEYVRIAKRIASAVLELARANEEEFKFFDELKDAGASGVRFRSMAVAAVGKASDRQSGAAFHQAELREHCPQALVS